MGKLFSCGSSLSAQEECAQAKQEFDEWLTIGLRGLYSTGVQWRGIPNAESATDLTTDGIHDLTLEQFRQHAAGGNFAPNAKYLFIILPNEHIRFANLEPAETSAYHGKGFGHTSLLSNADYDRARAGQAVVKWAGGFNTSDKGKINAISNDSGHFIPRGDPERIGHFLIVLGLKNVPYTEKKDPLTHKQVSDGQGGFRLVRKDTGDFTAKQGEYNTIYYFSQWDEYQNKKVYNGYDGHGYNGYSEYHNMMDYNYGNNEIDAGYGGYKSYNGYNGYYIGYDWGLMAINGICLLLIICLVCCVFGMICGLIGYISGKVVKKGKEKVNYVQQCDDESDRL